MNRIIIFELLIEFGYFRLSYFLVYRIYYLYYFEEYCIVFGFVHWHKSLLDSINLSFVDSRIRLAGKSLKSLNLLDIVYRDWPLI